MLGLRFLPYLLADGAPSALLRLGCGMGVPMYIWRKIWKTSASCPGLPKENSLYRMLLLPWR